MSESSAESEGRTILRISFAYGQEPIIERVGQPAEATDRDLAFEELTL